MELPATFRIHERQLIRGKVLGSGCYGIAYRATLNGLTVCIKVTIRRPSASYCARWRASAAQRN